MVNPSAARHLTLVVGVLLCFFVYMGYVIKNRQTTAADGAASSGTVPVPVSNGGSAEPRGDVPGLPLMTMGDGAEKSSSDRFTQIGVPGLPAPIGVDLPDPGGGASSSSSGELNLAEGLLAVGGRDDLGALRPPPAGSIEETATKPSGAITGLLPDTTLVAEAASPRPGGNGDASVAGVSLPPPPGSQSIDDTFAPLEQPPVVALRTEPAMPPTRPALPEPVAAPPRSAQDAPLRLRPAGGGTSATESRTATSNPPPAPTFGSGGSSAPLRIYVVLPGDTLSRIASRELGSMALADNIYLLNRDVISNPDHLLVGTKIKLPPRETVAAAAGGAQPLAPNTELQSGVQPGSVFDPEGFEGETYRVAPGDTLSSIALRFYGSSAGWRFLHESNLGVIPDPNRLTVGTEIVIPPYVSQ
ncbi:MAG: LysM peptidoglycan-binding domain-containing protein [Planctomycetota bacterium]|nr:LysM peptidoglycan-binding domain-containing protein [Planctomycetota bacterium]